LWCHRKRAEPEPGRAFLGVKAEMALITQFISIVANFFGFTVKKQPSLRTYLIEALLTPLRPIAFGRPPTRNPRYLSPDAAACAASRAWWHGGRLMNSSPVPVDRISAALPPELRSTLRLLLHALNSAAVAQRALWDFAVEVIHLPALGLSTNDLRLLIDHPTVQHALQRMQSLHRRCVFDPPDRSLLAQKSDFILTAASADVIRLLLPQAVSILPDRPHYDRELRKLWLGAELVKHLKQPAPDQHLILSAFEEEHWRLRIDDPLSPDDHHDDPKLRLNRAIYRLNRHHVNSLIHFHGDSTGKGITWEGWRPPSLPVVKQERLQRLW
jgi:hypothetical protein